MYYIYCILYIYICHNPQSGLLVNLTVPNEDIPKIKSACCAYAGKFIT